MANFSRWAVNSEIQKIIWDEQKVHAQVRRLGAEIARDYQQQLGSRLWREPPVAVGLLRGAFVFLADLVRELPIPLECDFLQLASYGKDFKPAEIRLVRDLEVPIKGRHVLIVEDIVDTGQTLSFLREMLARREPASVKFCALIDKTPRRRLPTPLDYVGFRFEEDAFLVGYGLDYAEKYRNLPFIAALKIEAFSQEP